MRFIHVSETKLTQIPENCTNSQKIAAAALWNYFEFAAKDSWFVASVAWLEEKLVAISSKLIRKAIEILEQIGVIERRRTVELVTAGELGWSPHFVNPKSMAYRLKPLEQAVCPKVQTVLPFGQTSTNDQIKDQIQSRQIQEIEEVEFDQIEEDNRPGEPMPVENYQIDIDQASQQKLIEAYNETRPSKWEPLFTNKTGMARESLKCFRSLLIDYDHDLALMTKEFTEACLFASQDPWWRAQSGITVWGIAKNCRKLAHRYQKKSEEGIKSSGFSRTEKECRERSKKALEDWLNEVSQESSND